MRHSVMIDKFTFKSIWIMCIIVACIAWVPVTWADQQIVKLSSDEILALSGDVVNLNVIYNVNGEKKLTTGLGIRIHYNSKAIEQLDLIDMYGEGMVGQNYTPEDDTLNLDEDPNTDKYIVAAWIGIRGGWPRLLQLPAKLGTAKITVNKDSALNETKINITATSSASGFKFVGQSTKIILQ